MKPVIIHALAGASAAAVAVLAYSLHQVHGEQLFLLQRALVWFLIGVGAVAAEICREAALQVQDRLQ